jgi:hypothetical protein
MAVFYCKKGVVYSGFYMYILGGGASPQSIQLPPKRKENEEKKRGRKEGEKREREGEEMGERILLILVLR